MIVRLHTDGERGCPIERLGRRLARRRDVVVERRAAADRSPAPEHGVAVRRTSRIRAAVGLDAPTVAGPDGELATALGASPVGWEGDDAWSPWEACRAPLPVAPRAGSPDLDARWLVVDALHASAIPSVATPGWQWHLVGARRRPPGHAVWWRADAAAALLGEAHAVIGASDRDASARRHGPLAIDAWRLGVPVLRPSGDAPVDRWAPVGVPSFDVLLANTLPPLLASDSGIWDEVLTRSSPAAPLLTPARIRAARERAQSDGRRLGPTIRREVAMLRDDPLARAREYRLWVVRKLWSSARPGRPSNTRGGRR